MPNDSPWWEDAVVYQIYPRSFADSTGNGVGDLAGVTQKLPYLEWLGVDAIWLSPFFRSPMYDFGYDVSDYCDVDPIFGTLADFDAMVEAAHARGIRVIIDWVPAHTSSEHAWFVEAKQGKSSSKRNWYVWRDPRVGEDGKPTVPNNWVGTFLDGAPAWTFDEKSGQYYLHTFLPQQPDLNWDEPGVEAAMHDTLRFWMDRGVDGFRADVIHNIGKDPALPDVEERLAKIPHSALNDEPRTHELLREIRKVLDAAPPIELPKRPEQRGGRMMVGEVFLLRTELVAAYYGQGDELQLSFNFPPLFAKWNAADWRACIEKTCEVLDPIDAWPTWVLSNHDQPRHRTRHARDRSKDEARARAAAVLLLALRGTPFLYMGEELGLEDAVVPEDRVVDPGGRDGCRAPLPWTADGAHGWGDDPWLPFPPEPAKRNVETLRADEGSILHFYRHLLAVRRDSAALRRGRFELVDAPEGVLAWRREAREDSCIVAINMTDEAIELGDGALARDASQRRLLLSTHDTAGDAASLRPNEARILA